MSFELYVYEKFKSHFYITGNSLYHTMTIIREIMRITNHSTFIMILSLLFRWCIVGDTEYASLYELGVNVILNVSDHAPDVGYIEALNRVIYKYFPMNDSDDQVLFSLSYIYP